MPQPITIEEIGQMDDESQEAGIPVFEARTVADSYMKFAFLESFPGLTVYHIESNRYGDMKRLMNKVVDQFQAGEDTEITFINVITERLPGKNLDEVLTGFEWETWEAQEGPHKGEEYEVLRGVWTRNKK